MSVSPRRAKKDPHLDMKIANSEANVATLCNDFDDGEKTPKNRSTSVVDVTPPVKDPGELDLCLMDKTREF